MHLSTVRIANFRGLREVTLALSPTTLLIGENNAGKTSVLDAIRLAMSRGTSRKTGTFDSYDHHLATADAEPQASDPIKIELTFTASDGEVVAPEVVQALADVLVRDAAGKPFVILRVTSQFDATANDFITDWKFLDIAGNALGPRSKRLGILPELQRLFPVFYLSALRDALREFKTGTFWTPFVRNPAIVPEVKKQLQDRIDQLNKDVLAAHASLNTVKTHLAKIRDLVSIAAVDTVDIDALPGRISDLLAGAQVNVSGVSGASIPLARHGAGTQSLSVLFLFHAYLSAMIQQQYSELSAPLLMLEEPEAHLHPFATRALWSVLSDVPGQKIVATHSGDLLASAPLTCITRLYASAGTVKTGSIPPSLLTPDEDRKVRFHISASRGELLFARCWILGEGESEHWACEGLARFKGLDLSRKGIRTVSYAQSGIECLLKVANALGIKWFLIADGDAAGKAAVKTARPYLNGATEADRILQLTEDNIELHLCSAGLGSTYEGHISPQKKANVIATAGTSDYWKQVIKAQDDTPKPSAIGEVIEAIEKGATAPPKLLEVLAAAERLAGE